MPFHYSKYHILFQAIKQRFGNFISINKSERGCAERGIRAFVESVATLARTTYVSVA